jgi:hypothetical protein
MIRNKIAAIAVIAVLCGFLSISSSADISASDIKAMAELPGEYTAEQILNGEYQWPESPEIAIAQVEGKGFDPEAFGKVPAPGVHPRIIFSPEDLPGIRARIKNTDIGNKAYANMVKRNAAAKEEGTAFSNVYKSLLSGEPDQAEKLLSDYSNAGKSDGTSWHHRPNFEYILMLECFDALISNDADRGGELATVVSTLAEVYQRRMDVMDANFKNQVDMLEIGGADANAMKPDSSLNSDVWRSGRRQAIGQEPYFGFMYDYAYNWMDDSQRGVCRKAINDYIRGKTTMGSHMPHHFRNWNWIAVGSGLLLTALATEGEEGNDSRVYEHQKEVQTDYIKYGWSQMGSSREAIGYTAFGLRWYGPSMVAMARRGHNMLGWQNWYNSLNWYAHSVQPGGGRFISHGDGGNSGPGAMTPLMFKNAYPNDDLADYVLQKALEEQSKGGDKIDGGRGYVMYQCIFANDPSNKDYDMGSKLGLEKTFFDPQRKSLITHSEFGKEEVQLQFECRDDAVAPNHQHADRGNFTLAGVGRCWAIDRFRGIESRHHNVVTIDGAGQGYFAPPGKWLGLVDNDLASFGVCDAKYAYDWYWQGTVSGFADKDQPRRLFKRWEHYANEADKWLAEHPGFDWRANIDRSPVVETYYNGFESGDPRMWDEYARPVCVPHNQVQKAFRSAGLVRGRHPYALVVDDIRKNDANHCYEWNMMVDSDIQLISIKTDEIILGEMTVSKQGDSGVYVPQPKSGDPLLLVKVLERTIPENVFNNLQIRLETFEYKDAREWPKGRSYGLAKRLVVPSYSIEPQFKILMFPHRNGDKLPAVVWNDDQTQAAIEWQDQKDEIVFKKDSDGRTTYKITREGKIIAEI